MLGLGAAAIACAQTPKLTPSAISASPTSLAPGDSVTFSVTVTNTGTATTADDFPVSGSVTANVRLTHKVTGAQVDFTGITFNTATAIAGAGGAGTLTSVQQIPFDGTVQAGTYDARVSLVSTTIGTATGNATSTSVLTVTGTPDLQVTGLTYPTGTAYRGGDVIPFTLSYTNRNSTNGSYNHGWGNDVIIDHGNGVQTLYAHMSTVSATVGQTVSGGTVIGAVGMTGDTTGPHLHLEVRGARNPFGSCALRSLCTL